MALPEASGVNVLLYLLRVFVWGILSCHVAGGGVEGGDFSEDRELRDIAVVRSGWRVR